MREYVTVVVEESLLPQVAREILSLTDNPDLVEVVHGDNGRVLFVEPDLAELWMTTVDFPGLPPAKRKPGRPRKIQNPSASPSEESS